MSQCRKKSWLSWRKRRRYFRRCAPACSFCVRIRAWITVVYLCTVRCGRFFTDYIIQELPASAKRNRAVTRTSLLLCADARQRDCRFICLLSGRRMYCTPLPSGSGNAAPGCCLPWRKRPPTANCCWLTACTRKMRRHEPPTCPETLPSSIFGNLTAYSAL